MSKALDRLAAEYERRFRQAGFRSTAEFKAEFFTRARQSPPAAASISGWRFHAWHYAAAAALVLLLGVGLSELLPVRPGTGPAKGRTLLSEARHLLEPDGVGVAVINDEVATFERNTRKKPDSLFELSFRLGAHGQTVKIQFAAASGDLIRVDTPLLQGEFWVYRVEKNLFVVDSDCRVKNNGNYVSVTTFSPLPLNSPQRDELNRLTITSRVQPL